MSNHLLLLPMHENSERVPDKMLRYVGGTCLAEIAIKKLPDVQRRTGCDIATWISSTDKRLLALGARLDVPNIERSAHSSYGESGRDIWVEEPSYIKMFDKYEWVYYFTATNWRLPARIIAQIAHRMKTAPRDKPVCGVAPFVDTVRDLDGNLVTLGLSTGNSKLGADYWLSCRSAGIGWPHHRMEEAPKATMVQISEWLPEYAITASTEFHFSVFKREMEDLERRRGMGESPQFNPIHD